MGEYREALVRTDPVFHGLRDDADFDFSQEFYMGLRRLPVSDRGV